MNFAVLFIFFSLVCFQRLSAKTLSKNEGKHAWFPPRGWNSYDSFSWIISEEEFLKSAEIVSQRLRPFGYEYVVIDYLWYRRKVEGAYTDSLGFDVIDKWGRMAPDPGRWPSSNGGKGSLKWPRKYIAWGGVYEENGRQWTAKDIALTERACAWMPHVKHDCVFGDDFDLNEITVVSEVLKELDRPIMYSLSPGTRVTPAMAKEVNGLVNMYRITGDDWDTWEMDLSTANMIGAKGLLGKSWPDMDMLPLGTLTDPGSNEGPHRKCRLTIDEQRTQMTLWSMAKSPLMFGGDFPYVTGMNGPRTRKQILSQGIRTCLTKVDKSDTRVLGLTSCKDSKPNGWSIKTLDQDLAQICWNDKDAEIIYKQKYQGKHHLLATDGMELCWDTSPKGKPTSKEFNRGSFSPCKWDANQMWELNNNGTLLNSHSGLCATVNAVQDDAVSGGIRSWIATGRKDLAKALPGRNLKVGSCKGSEVWSGKDLGIIGGSVSMTVEMHGCALFVLKCISSS
ncbi:hypothetical protein CK203_018439 [Vitis vinifera]|uniref:Alpha-galactosidase n=1 Tax=Vitis vinifera TaxID=29760 RepID=A0A438J5Y5_VITVI|nr:hypothetical protein CK203_018439 [Vitis vinifera]